MSTFRIQAIETESIVDGPGIRTTIFFQGCYHHCKGCHNPETHDRLGGRECTPKEIYQILESDPLIDGITYSGGDPVLQWEETLEMTEHLSTQYSMVLYTGYTEDWLLSKYKKDDKFKRYINAFEHIICEPFVEELKSLNTRFRGSSNQKILAVEPIGYGPLFADVSEQWDKGNYV